MAKHKTSPTVAALSLEIKPGQREHLLIPDGDFRSADGSGRPTEVPAWRMSAEIAGRLLARAQLRAAKIVVDYEHQTLKAAENGLPAPAAGRIDRRSLRYVPGQGVLGAIEWTPRAQSMIDAGEYAYLSPVFPYDEATGEVLALLHVALTNDPALDLPAVAALTAINDFSTEEEPQVNELLKKLLEKLGLSEAAGEADIEAAIDALNQKASAAEAKVAAMTALKPDPALYAPVAAMAELQTQVAALSAHVNGDKVGRLVESALTEGKLLPAQKDWALDLGKTNLAALTAYLEKTPAIVALGGTQTGGKPPGGSDPVAALSATEAAVAKQLGISDEAFAKTKAAA